MELHDLVIKNKNKLMHKNTSKIQDTLAIKIPMPKQRHFQWPFSKYFVLAQNLFHIIIKIKSFISNIGIFPIPNYRVCKYITLIKVVAV